MTTPLLSILIPTTPDRENDVLALLDCIDKQTALNAATIFTVGSIDAVRYKGSAGVEVIIFSDNREMTIGEKRELLYKEAKGGWCWQIDSDDLISENAIELVLEAIKSNPEVDVISFEERVRLDGIEYRSNHSNEYGIWEGDGNSLFPDGFHFHRSIFFKNVIRAELARSVPIVHCRYGEDNMYADALKPFIRSEIHINEQIYLYNYISTPHDERYGINQ